MIFFKINLLAEQLKTNSVPESDKFKYYLSVPILYLIASFLPETKGSFDILINAFSYIIEIALLCYLFYLNGGPKGQCFVERCVCLFIPASIRALVFGVPASLLIIIVVDLLSTGKVHGNLIDLVVILVMNVFLFFDMSEWIKYLTKHDSINKNETAY